MALRRKGIAGYPVESALGVIKCKVYREVPPKVEYSLAEKGESLKPIILDLEQWGRTLEVEKMENNRWSVFTPGI